MSNISFLIDTNIFLPLEPIENNYVNSNIASEFYRLVQENDNQILLHPIILEEFKKDKNIHRREIREVLNNKYTVLENPPNINQLPNNIIKEEKKYSNSWYDNHFISAVYNNHVHYLVSEDRGVHKKAQKLNIQDKVLFLDEAIELLNSFNGKNINYSAHVEYVHPNKIDISLPFFESLRNDYPDFVKWFNSKVKPDTKRRAFIIKSKEFNDLSALAILKNEDGVEYGPNGNTLKICTFKVMPAFGQNRFGELLLKSILLLCKSKRYEYTYLTVYEKHNVLINFLKNFGFIETKEKKDNGEYILYKKLIPSKVDYETLKSLEFNIKYGPYSFNFSGASSFLIPIRPNYFDILFPELSLQGNLFSDSACGNSIRKSYISHSPTRKIKVGDMLFFYRSEYSDLQVVGIVENTIVSKDLYDIIAFVGNRTIYSHNQIKEMIIDKESLVVNFRVVLTNDKPLIAKDVTNIIPQSIYQIDDNLAKSIISSFNN